MHWQYVIPGYLIVFVGLALYAALLLSRIRSAAARIPEEKRPFLD
jgi:hypothetical protein